jgi:hypothetical protein
MCWSRIGRTTTTERSACFVRDSGRSLKVKRMRYKRIALLAIGPLLIWSISSSVSFGEPACSGAIELGPWLPVDGHGQDVFIDAGTGFVQVDFWRPGGPPIKAGYDDVLAIISPGTRITVTNVAGQAWKYDSTCVKSYVERQVERYNTEKRQGGWSIATINVSELPLSFFHFSQLRLGVNMHPLQDIYAPTHLSQQMELVHRIAPPVIRIDIHWGWIEPSSPGVENWDQNQIARLNAFLDGVRNSNVEILATVLEAPCAWASTAPDKCNTPEYWRYPPINPQDYARFLGELLTTLQI